jgi:hypothetical protein
MQTLAGELRAEIDATLPRLRAIDEAAASADRGPGKWARKEVLGQLVELWAALNHHLAYAIESVPASALQRRCVIGTNEPVTLEWIIRDYLRHLRHHLAQILQSTT